MISERARKLGEALVKAKILTENQLREAMTAAQNQNSPSLIIGLLESGYLTYQIFEKFLTSSLGIKTAIVADMPADKSLLKLLSEKFIRDKRIYPIAMKNSGGAKTLALGMVDPLDSETLDYIQQKYGVRVIPVLISLPDFKAAIQNKFAGEAVELGTMGGDDKIVVIRPGGYEEEIAFQAKMNEKTRTTQEERPKRITEQGSGVFSLGQDANKAKSRFFGAEGKKFREEILAKLELMGSDTKALKKDTYTKELLFGELPEISTKPLEKIYDRISDQSKLEGLINALIKNGAVTKRDVLVATAISYVFSDNSEENKK